jgi:hypothetical protein
MRRSLATSLAVASLLGLSACSAASTSNSAATTPTTSATVRQNTAPQVVLDTALANGRAATSVHYVSASREANQRVTITGDVNRTDGTQTIDYVLGSARGTLVVRLIGHEAYFRGDAVTLYGFMGMTTEQATTYANRWISTVPGDPNYANTAAALTVSSVISEIGLGAPIEGVSPATSPRTAAVILKGRLIGPSAPSGGGTSTLTVSSSSRPLPILFSGLGTKKQAFTFTLGLSRWGEPVQVSPPASSIPLSTILGAANPTSPPSTII